MVTILRFDIGGTSCKEYCLECWPYSFNWIEDDDGNHLSQKWMQRRKHTQDSNVPTSSTVLAVSLSSHQICCQHVLCIFSTESEMASRKKTHARNECTYLNCCYGSILVLPSNLLSTCTTMHISNLLPTRWFSLLQPKTRQRAWRLPVLGPLIFWSKQVLLTVPWLMHMSETRIVFGAGNLRRTAIFKMKILMNFLTYCPMQAGAPTSKTPPKNCH